ncbi:MAG: hypothetical protein ACHREM_20875 [Polyangiales bacterium]
MKSRQRLNVPNSDNFGDYMLIDVASNLVVRGYRFDMTAAEVIQHCAAVDPRSRGSAG